MIDRYSFEDWMHYGKRGKREYSCFRFYSVGLSRGIPLVILDTLMKFGFGGLIAWFANLFVEKLLTDGKFPWAIDWLTSHVNMASIPSFLFIVCLVVGWVAVHSLRRGFRNVRLLDELQSFNYQVENETLNSDVYLSELATVCCKGVASCFSIFRPHAGIGCAIRLVCPGKSDHEVGYATVAREGALNATRFQHSRPLSMGSKIVLMLHKKELSNHIVMLCPNVEKARDCGQLDNDVNSEHFGSDDRCMMISRLVARDGSNNSIMGILYVISNRPNKLGIADVNLYLLLHDIVNHALCAKAVA